MFQTTGITGQPFVPSAAVASAVAGETGFASAMPVAPVAIQRVPLLGRGR